MDQRNCTIKNAANYLGISEATCRNWIKADILKTIVINGKKYIDWDSISLFLQNDLNGKLSCRRNKTNKIGKINSVNYLLNKESQNLLLKLINNIGPVDSEEEIKYILRRCSEIFLLETKKYSKESIDILNDIYFGDPYEKYNFIFFEKIPLNDDFLGALYMCLKSINARKNEGMYYTPEEVVNVMYENIKKQIDVTNKSLIDICCGTGNFLIKALDNGFKAENIYGLDNDLVSVSLARINMFLRSDLKLEKICSNIRLADSLLETLDLYDVCVGNPPWGAELSADYSTIKTLYDVANSKSVDPFCLFIEKGLRITKDKGIMYYVCPESLCNVSLHKATRQYIMKEAQILNLNYLGNVFDGVQAPAISICLKKEQTEDFGVNAHIVTKNDEYIINQNRIFTFDLWDFNISNVNYNVLEEINKNKDIIYLKNNAKFALGIVTGNNTKYVLTSPSENGSNLVKGQNIYKYSMQVGKYYLEYDREKFQQVAPDEIYFAKEKLIYRFISDTLVFAYDNAQTLTLNSANICIPNIDGIPMKYVLAILNSRLAHFIFKLKYNSVKVLRNHIENIPIFLADPCEINEIIKLVDMLLIEKEDNKKLEVYNILDEYILDLYRISKESQNIIKNFNKNNIFLLP